MNLLLNCFATALVEETVVLLVDCHALFDLSQKHGVDEALMEDVSSQELVGLTKPFIFSVIVRQVSDAYQDWNVTVMFPCAIFYDFYNALYEDIARQEVTYIELIVLDTGGQELDDSIVMRIIAHDVVASPVLVYLLGVQLHPSWEAL